MTLIKDSEKRKVTTDTFGDFKFDGLKENSGIYHIEVFYEDREVKSLKTELKKTVNVGTIFV